MAKNIAIFSDGTGNSGAKLNGTNVWRLFEALDRTPPNDGGREQIALYDDGVGTNSFKPLRMIGGAFGWGITANLERLYAYLIRNYEPGDDIYMFGFSRGAFTVRTLSNILFYCGLPSGKEQESGLVSSWKRRSPDEIDQMAREAVEAYKRRVQGRRDLGQPNKLRDRFVSIKQGLGDVPIKFLGVWDTVDAIGLPFDEMTKAFSWFMPLRLGESMLQCRKVYEDDLHENIEYAYQALAIDDRRYTFHPLLFQDKYPVGSVKAGQLKPIAQDEKTRNDRAIPRLQQVWFAGMHSNVGGGYAQDSMSLVTLNWMLERISSVGASQPAEKLRFTTLVNDYKRDADHLGRMYDSRKGTGIFYRYRPRSIQKLTDEYGCTKPLIHWTVIDRIAQRRETYLPPDLPQSYAVVDAPAGFHLENDPDGRYAEQHPALHHMFVGRIQYWTFVGLFLLLALWAWLNNQPQAENMNSVRVLLSWPEGAVLDLVSIVLPAYFESGVTAFRANPGSLTVSLLIFGFLWAWSNIMLGQLRQIAHTAWSASLPVHQTSKSISAEPSTFKQDMPTPLLRSWFRDSKLGLIIGKTNRGSLGSFRNIVMKPAALFHQMVTGLVAKIGFNRLDRFVDWFNWKIAPPAVVVVVILLVCLLGWRGVWRVRLAIRAAADVSAVKQSTEKGKPHQFEFNTTEPMQDSSFEVEQGKSYRIEVKVTSDWRDDTIPASPAGVRQPPWLLKVFVPLRRSMSHPWMRLMMSIGPTNSNLVSIGQGVESFTATESGRLYFFVNDAPADMFYNNNHGAATITITRLD